MLSKSQELQLRPPLLINAIQISGATVAPPRKSVQMGLINAVQTLPLTFCCCFCCCCYADGVKITPGYAGNQKNLKIIKNKSKQGLAPGPGPKDPRPRAPGPLGPWPGPAPHPCFDLFLIIFWLFWLFFHYLLIFYQIFQLILSLIWFFIWFIFCFPENIQKSSVPAPRGLKYRTTGYSCPYP